jgi:hypothetical protein
MVTGLENPVVQVVSEPGGETLYGLRISGQTFSPWVGQPGSYTIRIGEPGTGNERVVSGLTPEAEATDTLVVRFGETGG